MSILHTRGSRGLPAQAGASVLAAVAFVALFGLITMVVINISPSKNEQVYTAQARVSAVSQAAAADAAATPSASDTKQQQISDECKKGEVHTVKEETAAPNSLSAQAGLNDIGGSGPTSKTTETNTRCYIPDLNACKTTDADKCSILKKNEPTFTQNSDCKISKIDKCVVQYCPLSSMVSKAGTCYVISCAQGDDACLKKALASTQKGSVQAISELQAQSNNGLGVYNPTTALTNPSLQSSLSPDAFKAVDTQQQITANENKIASLDQQIQACTDCANSAQMNAERIALQEKNAQLQKTFDTQMENLSKNQVAVAPGTNPGITPGGEDQPGVADYCKNNPAACNANNTMTTPLPKPRPADAPATAPAAPTTPAAPAASPSTGFLSSLFGNSNSPASRAMANGLAYQVGNMIGSLISGKGFGGTSQQQTACATTQDQYQQQQQQYNQQIQQYNYQLQQQQYQQQQQMLQQQYGGGGAMVPVYGYDQYGQYLAGYQPAQPSYSPYGSTYGSPYGSPYGSQYVGGNMYGQSIQPPQQPPQPCYNNQQPQQCSSSPQQPSYESCTSGTWKPTTNGNGCVGGWQCVPNGSSSGTGGTGTGTGTTNTPAATISCQPRIADVGMSVAISFACANAVQSVGGGFNTGGALSGSATTTIQTPPQNTNTVTYTLTCNNQGATAGAQCSVQFGKPGIVFLANPPTIHIGESVALGWVTSGMQSCVVSSPDLPGFTAQNADRAIPNGVAAVQQLTATARFDLNCTTAGGAHSSASTTVTVIPAVLQ